MNFGEHVGDKAILNTDNDQYKNKINDILATKGNSSTYINMIEDEMKKIVAAQQRSTADELGYEKIGDTYYIVIKNQVSDEKIGLDLSKEERDFYIQKTHEWREIINSNEKNVFYQVNNNIEEGNAGVYSKPSDLKYENGKFLVDNSIMVLNSDSMNKEFYTSIAVDWNPITGDIIYKDVPLGNIIDHEGIHVTDNLLNGISLENKDGIYQKKMYSKYNIFFYNRGVTSTMDLIFPLSEKRAIDHEGILNIINKGDIIKRKFHGPDNIKNVKPIF